jgi:hypothetical protein
METTPSHELESGGSKELPEWQRPRLGMTERVADSIDRPGIVLGKKPTGNGELFWRGALKTLLLEILLGKRRDDTYIGFIVLMALP